MRKLAWSMPVAVLAAVLIGLPVLGTGCQKLQARDHLNKGVNAFKNAQYPEAVEHFKQAVELDPNFPTARLYLATGHEGLGITTSLATGRLVADRILGRPPAIPIEPYLPGRKHEGAHA